MSAARMTAEEFEAARQKLAAGGRWSELVAGEFIALQPPDEEHGNVVRNLSAVLARVLAEQAADPPGYACFELGLIVARGPDTVRTPPISYFNTGELFAESDRLITTTPPALVVDIASTSDRRTALPLRIEQYHSFGVQKVWIVDPPESQVHIAHHGSPVETLTAGSELADPELLPGFSMPVDYLFTAPAWWND